jgi:hypothetical protein
MSAPIAILRIDGCAITLRIQCDLRRCGTEYAAAIISRTANKPP